VKFTTRTIWEKRRDAYTHLFLSHYIRNLQVNAIAEFILEDGFPEISSSI
jgi:hypothetical protein